MKDEIERKKEELTKETQKKINKTKKNAALKKEEIRGRADKLNEKINNNELIKSTENYLNEVVDIIRQNHLEFGKSLTNYSITQKPLTDIIETSEAFIIKMDLPDLNKEDLKVNIEENNVYIKAKYPEESNTEGVNYIQKERNHDSIMKTIPIPCHLLPGHQQRHRQRHRQFRQAVRVVFSPVV